MISFGRFWVVVVVFVILGGLATILLWWLANKIDEVTKDISFRKLNRKRGLPHWDDHRVYRAGQFIYCICVNPFGEYSVFSKDMCHRYSGWDKLIAWQPTSGVILNLKNALEVMSREISWRENLEMENIKGLVEIPTGFMKEKGTT